VSTAELRALLDAATPGPWEVEASGAEYDADDNEIESGWMRGPQMLDKYDYETLRLTDAALIVAAVNALPELLDELEHRREAMRIETWCPVCEGTRCKFDPDGA
jgi:hypothetical protein